MKYKSLLLLLVLFANMSFGQDTIRIMYYNLLNYPDESPERVNYLRTIVQYAQPDILVVNELLSEEGSDLILSDALNVWGASNYEAATFVNGPDTDNMLYYNSNKVGLIDQYQVPTGLRDISEYVLYYKSPGLEAASDTIYLNIYSAHLKAGSGFFAQRKEEAQTLKFHLNTKAGIENVFVGGDFNFYSGNESGCLTLREVGDLPLVDPIDQIGDWNNNITYANIHTQSTRTSPLADGAGGGMDDRFDMVFTSNDILTNENGLRFLTDSYQALGQDGDRFNGAINAPFNPSVPDSVVDALYYMSDHLPVLMEVETDYTASIESYILGEQMDVFFNSAAQTINLKTAIHANYTFSMFDMSGREVLKTSASSEQIPIGNQLGQGIYVYYIVTKKSYYTGKVCIRY